MTLEAFRLDRKSTGAQQLEGLWGPRKGELLYDVSAFGGGKGNHATRVGAGAIDQLSDRGRVMLFNGVDDAWNCERRIALALGSFTLCAWVWLDSTVTQRFPVIVAQADAGVRRWAFWVDDANGAGAKLEFGAIATVVAAPAGSFHAVKDQWVHVAVRRWIRSDGFWHSHTAIYQDGQVMATDESTYAQYNPTEVLQIGNHRTSWWHGMISDVRHYSRALTPAQITHIYRTTRWTPYADIMLRPTRRYVHRHRGALEAD